MPARRSPYPPPVLAFTLQTPLQKHPDRAHDLPGPTGGIILKTTTGAFISINEIGITIQNGQGATIVMAGPSDVINDGALTVVTGEGKPDRCCIRARP